MGLLGEAKVLCILRHWGIQLISAYSWARPASHVAGKGRRGMFLFLLFLHFHSFSPFSLVPLFHHLYYLYYLSSSLGDNKVTQKGWRVIKPQHNQTNLSIEKKKKKKDLAYIWTAKVQTYIFTDRFYNPSLAEHDMPCLSKQCRSRSVGFWRSQLIWICTVCH